MISFTPIYILGRMQTSGVEIFVVKVKLIAEVIFNFRVFIQNFFLFKIFFDFLQSSHTTLPSLCKNWSVKSHKIIWQKNYYILYRNVKIKIFDNYTKFYPCWHLTIIAKFKILQNNVGWRWISENGLMASYLKCIWRK